MDFLEGADFDINLPDIIVDKTGPAEEDRGAVQGAHHGGRSSVSGQVGGPEIRHGFEMKYGADGKPMRMQAIEQIASPFNRHPVTGELLWFCNIHNHARYLRDRRPCTVPEVGMTEVFYGDLISIPSPRS